MDYSQDHDSHMDKRLKMRKALLDSVMAQERLRGKSVLSMLRIGEVYSRAMRLKSGMAEPEKMVSVPEKELERLRSMEKAHDDRLEAYNKVVARRDKAEWDLSKYLAEDRVAVSRALDLERMVDILQAEVLGLRKPSWLTRALGFFR